MAMHIEKGIRTESGLVALAVRNKVFWQCNLNRSHSSVKSTVGKKFQNNLDGDSLGCLTMLV